MAKIESKNLVLHGVGEAFLLSPDGKIATRLSRMQSLSIEVTSESEDVYGGDSLFPFFNYIKSKSAQFKFKNAVFDMNVLAATQGTAVVEGGQKNVVETVSVASNTANLTATSGIDVDSVVVMTADGAVLTQVTSPTSDTEYAVTATGTLTFSEGFADQEVTVSYVCTVADGSTVHVKTNDVPGFVELRHVSMPIKLKDGRTVEVHTRVYKAVCDGGFSLEYTRDGAVAPEVTFKSVDPERADKNFVSYSLVEVK